MPPFAVKMSEIHNQVLNKDFRAVSSSNFFFSHFQRAQLPDKLKHDNL